MDMQDRIRKIRKDAGETQEQFAAKIGVSKVSVAYYETGQRSPSKSLVQVISHLYNVNETWLLTGEGNPDLEQTREQRIASVVTNMMKGYSESDRIAMIEWIVGLSDEQIELAKQMVKEAYEKLYKKDQ